MKKRLAGHRRSEYEIDALGVMNNRTQEKEVFSPPAVIRLSPNDNVCIAARTLESGSTLKINGETHRLDVTVGLGHKIAAEPIAAGTKIIKCHVPIGSATCDIAQGEHIHLHNMKSDYLPTFVRSDMEGEEEN